MYVCAMYTYIILYVCVWTYIHTYTYIRIQIGTPEELKTLADAMFAEMDKNRDGHVTFKEYFAVVSREMPDTTEKNEMVCVYMYTYTHTYMHTFVYTCPQIFRGRFPRNAKYHGKR
jgi:hypothetical protein